MWMFGGRGQAQEGFGLRPVRALFLFKALGHVAPALSVADVVSMATTTPAPKGNRLVTIGNTSHTKPTSEEQSSEAG